MALRVLRDEFRLKNFGYNYPDPSAFWRYQWICWDIEHLTLRSILALYATYAWIHEITNYYLVAVNHDALSNSQNAVNCSISSNYTASSTVAPGRETSTHLSTTTVYSMGQAVTDAFEGREAWDTRRPWYVFLTLWSFTVLTIHLVLAAILAFVFTFRKTKEKNSFELEDSSGIQNASYRETEEDDESKVGVYSIQQIPELTVDIKPSSYSADTEEEEDANLPWYFQLSWLLSDIITPVAPIVTLIFFGALYTGFELDIFNINTHALNSVLVFLDQVISARPIRLLHVVAPIVFGIVYGIFNFIFWTSDHKEHLLYPGVIDWSDPGQTILNMSVLAFVLVPVMVVFWFLFYRLKLKIYAWRYRNRK